MKSLRTGTSLTRTPLVAVMLALASVACVPHAAAASPPRAFAAPMELSADTARVTFAACNVSAPTVGCRVTLSGTIAGNAITFPAVADLTPGQTKTVAVAVSCSTVSQAISVTVSSRGLNGDGDPSPPTTATGSATLPACAPGQPGAFTVTITVGP